jgi:hypothetical protein
MHPEGPKNQSESGFRALEGPKSGAQWTPEAAWRNFVELSESHWGSAIGVGYGLGREEARRDSAE